METATAEFNLNARIRVKIADGGFEAWKASEDETLPVDWHKPLEYYKEKADSEGYVPFQFWHFMQIFGPHTGMGFQQLYHPTILLDPKDVKQQQEASV